MERTVSRPRFQPIRRLGYVLGAGALAFTLAMTGACAENGQTTVAGADKSAQIQPGQTVGVDPSYGLVCVVNRNIIVNGVTTTVQAPTLVDVLPGQWHQLTTTDPRGDACESYGGPVHPAGHPEITYIRRSHDTALRDALAGIGTSAPLVEIH